MRDKTHRRPADVSLSFLSFFSCHERPLTAGNEGCSLCSGWLWGGWGRCLPGNVHPSQVAHQLEALLGFCKIISISPWTGCQA